MDFTSINPVSTLKQGLLAAGRRDKICFSACQRGEREIFCDMNQGFGESVKLRTANADEWRPILVSLFVSS